METRHLLLMMLSVTLIVISSCRHEPPINNNNNNANGGICFESQILPIFQSSCAYAGCHDAITSADGYNFTSYANIMASGNAIKPNNPGDSKVIRYITEDDPDKIMPPPPNAPLSASQISLITQWINEGAQNTVNCAASCDTSTFKFNADIKPILESHCTGCHSGALPDAGINLSNHSGVLLVVNSGRLFGTINHQAGFSPMPKNNPKLSNCQITKIKKWIDNGAQND
ncbi:MAG: c-type cytochrome domain-containing protein [Flavobacteriales bacterium]